MGLGIVLKKLIFFFWVASFCYSAIGSEYLTIPLQERFIGENKSTTIITTENPVIYLDAKKRKHFLITILNGLLYDAQGQLLDTKGREAIFVMDSDGNLYVSNYHSQGVFHHSSFLAGGLVSGAGKMRVDRGQLKYLNNWSGHYLPSEKIHEQVLMRLRKDHIVPAHAEVLSMLQGAAFVS